MGVLRNKKPPLKKGLTVTIKGKMVKRHKVRSGHWEHIVGLTEEDWQALHEELTRELGDHYQLTPSPATSLVESYRTSTFSYHRYIQVISAYKLSDPNGVVLVWQYDPIREHGYWLVPIDLMAKDHQLVAGDQRDNDRD